MNLIFAILLLLLAIGGVVVRKTYYYLPASELKRQAAKHDPLAVRLYSAAAYGSSLDSLLWIFIVLTSAGGIILLARTAPLWLSLAAVISLLAVAYAWLPATRVTRFGARLTAFVTPLIVGLLNYLHPILSRAVDAAKRYSSSPVHTGLYERDDLLVLIEQQRQQTDNRLSGEELDIAQRALSFGDYKVSSLLTPRKQIKTIQADETVGPILIDELHQSGQPFVLVRDGGPKGPIIGNLEINKLGINSQGHVRDLMNPTVHYVHENDSLREALHVFFVTNNPLFVVVNSFEEYVGVLTIEAMLRQLVGHVPGDDFDQHADLTAVAARHSKAPKSTQFDETPVKTEEEVVE